MVNINQLKKSHPASIKWRATDISPKELYEVVLQSGLRDIHIMSSAEGMTVAMCRNTRTSDALNGVVERWLQEHGR